MEWVNKNVVKQYMKVLRDAVEELNAGDYDIEVIARLVGSAKKNLVLTNDSRGSFDCDVDIIITWKSDRIRIEDTRQLVNEIIGPKLRNAGYISFTNRTRTFNYKRRSTNNFTHSFDLMIQTNNEPTSSVNIDKNGQFSLGLIQESRNYKNKENIIKNENLENRLRNLYKRKKENNNQHKESYILYCECLNELTQHVRR